MVRINEIRGLLRLEKKHTLGSLSPLHVAKIALTRDSAWLRWRYVRYMRLQQYSCGLLKLYYSMRKNILGNKLGFEMSGDNVGEGVYLIHNGPIVINSAAVLGKGVRLHGDNCIGNDGITDDCPFIGDGVDIGVGAKVLGGVSIASGCVIGAGAVVVRDAPIPGSVLVGVPAKVIKTQSVEGHSDG